MHYHIHDTRWSLGDTALPVSSSGPCTEGAGNYTLMVSGQLSRLAVYLPSGMRLPQASAASAGLRLLPWEPFSASSPGYLTHRSRPYLESSLQARSCTGSRRTPHCAACSADAFSAARGQPCPAPPPFGLAAGGPAPPARLRCASETFLLASPHPSPTLGPPLHSSSALFSTLNTLRPGTIWFLGRPCPSSMHPGVRFLQHKRVVATI